MSRKPGSPVLFFAFPQTQELRHSRDLCESLRPNDSYTEREWCHCFFQNTMLSIHTTAQSLLQSKASLNLFSVLFLYHTFSRVHGMQVSGSYRPASTYILAENDSDFFLFQKCCV